MADRPRHEDNRRGWNLATEAHNSHKADQAAFLRAGGSTLFPEEIELLGDLAGRSLLHLQCNAGQDTLSLARRGATVTGVDISDTAIDFARQLAADSGIPASFERADVYDWLAEAAAAGRRFDVVFCSYGFLCWLSDLSAWAAGIAAVLAPGGHFAAVEFHPFQNMFDWEWRLASPYFTDGSARTWESGIGDYVALSGPALTPSGWRDGVANFGNPHPGHEWTWTLSQVVTALIDAGLTLAALREYPYMNGAKLLARMREEPGGRMLPPAELPSLPLMFGLVARKPGE
jgi:SAM-dependent methyltransferase